jgi:DNA-binding GntR family transcriptional regulator
MEDGRSLQHLSSATLADQAYEALREAIISGELASKEKVTERGLAERLAVSPTPVREALRRLEQDRLVERRGPRLVQVADLEGPAADELRFVEGSLRAVAARLAAGNATAIQLGRMEQLLDEGDRELARLAASDRSPDTLTADDLAPVLDVTRRFHAALNEGCNNPVVLRMLSLVDAFSLAGRRRRLAGELGVADDRSALERFQQHRAIFEAVRAGDGDTAERLMREHSAVDTFAKAKA